MKRILSAIGLALFIAVSSASFVNAQDATEKINDYLVDIVINQDGSINVNEKIVYDFGVAEKHGIFRNIPYKYKARGGSFALRITDIKVTNENGESYQFSDSTESGDLVLKIGDPDSTVTGVKNYWISYTVRRAINYFEDHDELYWNAIGTQWPVPILQSKVTVHTPASSTNAQCYIGQLGSTETLCTITDNKKDLIDFVYAKSLQPGEGFTISVGLPAGTIAKPTTQQKILDIVRDNGILALPFLVLGVMYWLWRKYGKDARSKTVVPQYDPPKDLPPLYMGALVDGRVDNRDLSAEIIHLATLGYLTITRVETTKLIWFKGSDYRFTKLDKLTDGLMPQSKAIYDALFADGEMISLSSYKSDTGFGKKLMAIESEVFSELTSSGYYRKNPKTVFGIYLAAGIMFAAIGAAILGSFLGTFGVVAAIASGLVIIAFSFIMPARTAKGAEARDYILGLKKYLGVAEKDRLEFHNAPEKNPQLFETLLPFAIALGVERLWAHQFENIYKQKPNWYSDSSASAFNASMFGNSLGDFSSSLNSAVASTMSTASSGGSGFSGGGSGGGGGGGGGGSW